MRRYYSYPYHSEPLNFPIEPIARRFSIVAIILCLALVFFNLGAHAILDPKKMAEHEMERISKDYYENYYYDNFIANLSEEDAAIAFTTYSEYGFPKIFLRELLLFDNGRHADSRSFFDGQYYCNTNHTSMQIVPKYPYGKKDYDILYSYECQWQ